LDGLDANISVLKKFVKIFRLIDQSAKKKLVTFEKKMETQHNVKALVGQLKMDDVCKEGKVTIFMDSVQVDFVIPRYIEVMRNLALLQ
jgi:hypothetical protein